MNAKKPKISIIIPIYKVEKELDRCVKSVKNQTFHNLEIILVDDGSPDGCPQMCDKYAKEDCRVIVIHKENGGLSDARNAGLKVATGDYILYVDSDDYLELDACQRFLQYLDSTTDIVIGACREVKGEQITYQKHTNLIEGKIYTAEEYVISSIKNNEWYAPAWLNLYKREFLLKHNLFYEKGIYFEDIEMLPRLFLSNPKVIYMDYVFYNYIIRENSIMTSKVTDEKIEMLLRIYKEWIKYISHVDDLKYQKYLYGVLVKYYITSAKQQGFYGWKIKKLNFYFAWKYALNIKERIKILIFNFFPKQYVKLKR